MDFTATKEEVKWRRLNARLQEVKTARAFRYLRSFGIEPVLIKGWAAARNYPGDQPRFYDDVDLAVSHSDLERARNVLSNGDGPKLNVDLHDELRHLDTKRWDRILADSKTVDLDSCPIRIPSAEDHFRILAVHWLNDGGQNRFRLWDLYYALEAEPEFDWDKCLGEVDRRRRDWIVAAVGLAHRFIGMPIESLPFAAEAADLPDWLVKAVEKEWRSGVRLKPLVLCLRDPAEFLVQVRKRLPPNPIESTIEMGGDIRGNRRAFYQLGSIMKRVSPSVLDLGTMLKARID